MMAKTSMLSLLAAVTVLLGSGTAHAYKCQVPALVDPVKKAVCASALLTSMDRRESANRRSVGASLPYAARGQLEADRTVFVRTLQACASETRCLEATYTSQFRLYDRLRRCAPEHDPTACTRRTIEQHRQTLHRSL